MMKRIVSALCAISAVFVFTACGSGESSSAASEATSAATAAPASETAPADSSLPAEEPEEDDSPYTLNGDFSKGPNKRWHAAAGYSNGNMFNCTWKEENAMFEDGVLKLKIDKLFDDYYTGGEYRTHKNYSYGLYEVSMKPIKNVGVVSSFFTYTGESDGNPWDEIDIEFLGKDTTKVQFNYFTDGKGNHEKLYDLGFDATEEFHTYGFRWAKDSITWYVDGKEVHKATENIPSHPGKIMMNTWNGIGVDQWLGHFDGNTPLTAEYQWARFTAE